MNPIITVVLGVVVVITRHGLPMLAWWLQLRWQTQKEDARRQYLVAIAHSLPSGGQIVEERSDGTWLRLGITRGPGEEDDGG